MEWLRRIERRLESPVAWGVAVALVAALQAWLILTHDAWLDEWQALAIAVHSPDLHDLLANLQYEGHPPAWYLLLRGLAAVLPDPRMALAAAALLLAAISQGLILLASPFTRLERLGIALSQFMLIEFLTISRSYTLGTATLLVALALWQRRRASWLPIAFLPQCDFLFGVIALGLIALRWREQRLWRPGIALFVASGLIAAWTVVQAPDFVPAIAPYPVPLGFIAWATRIATIGVPLQWGDGQLTWNAIAPLALIPAGAALLGVTVLQELRRAPVHLMAFLGFVAVSLAFNLFVYPLSVRHLFLVGLVFIALVWLRTAALHRPTGPLFRIWLLIAAGCGLTSAAITMVVPFDTSHLVAREIERRGLIDRRLVTYRDIRAPEIAANLGRPVQPIGWNCTTTFMRWNRPTGSTNADHMLAWMAAQSARDGRFYLISEVPVLAPRLARLLAQVPRGQNGIPYYLYEIGTVPRYAQPVSRRCDAPLHPQI